jgi:hypothetical protein
MLKIYLIIYVVFLLVLTSCMPKQASRRSRGTVRKVVDTNTVNTALDELKESNPKELSKRDCLIAWEVNVWGDRDESCKSKEQSKCEKKSKVWSTLKEPYECMESEAYELLTKKTNCKADSSTVWQENSKTCKSIGEANCLKKAGFSWVKPPTLGSNEYSCKSSGQIECEANSSTKQPLSWYIPDADYPYDDEYNEASCIRKDLFDYIAADKKCIASGKVLSPPIDQFYNGLDCAPLSKRNTYICEKDADMVWSIIGDPNTEKNTCMRKEDHEILSQKTNCESDSSLGENNLIV